MAADKNKKKKDQLSQHQEKQLQLLESIQAELATIQQHYQDIANWASDVQQKINNADETISDMPHHLKQATLGAEKLSKTFGNINDDVMQHTKNLTLLKQQYRSMSIVGKQWMSALNFSSVYKNMNKSLTQHKGIFLSAYTKISSVITSVSRNMSNLGQTEFKGVISQIKDLDKQIIEIQSAMNKSISQSTAKMMEDQADQLKTNISKAMTELQKNIGSKSISQQIFDLQTIKGMTGELQKITRQLKGVSIQSDEALASREKELEKLKQYRHHLYQVGKLQQSLNQKLKPIMEGIDTIAQGANKFKDSFFSIFSIGPITLPGVAQLSAMFDTRPLAKSMKQTMSEVTSAFTLGFATFKKNGKLVFTDLAKSFGMALTGIINGITSMVIGIMKMVVTGFLGVIGALFVAAMQRRQQLQSAYMSAQQSSGAISGGGQKGNFGRLYGQLGGLFGGEKAAEVYAVFRKVTDTLGQTGNQVQFLNRRLGVSATTSSMFLQNMKYVYGMTEKTRGAFAVLVAKAANFEGVLPERVLKDMAQATGQITIYLGKNPKTLAKSALFAAKMNMSMQDMLKAAKGLDDIEKSIQKSMELQLMTGSQLDIGQMIKLNQLGKGSEAVALMFDQLGPAINTQSKTVKNAISQMLGGMDFNVIKGAYQQSKKSGLSFSQELAKSGIQADEIMEKSASGVIQKTNTSAWALLTSMESLQNQIASIIYQSFAPVTKIFYDNMPIILDIFRQFVKLAANLTLAGLKWLTKPENVERIKTLFKSISDWFKDEKNQQKIKEVFKQIGDIIRGIVPIVLWLIRNTSKLFNLLDKNKKMKTGTKVALGVGAYATAATIAHHPIKSAKYGYAAAKFLGQKGWTGAKALGGYGKGVWSGTKLNRFTGIGNTFRGRGFMSGTRWSAGARSGWTGAKIGGKAVTSLDKLGKLAKPLAALTFITAGIGGIYKGAKAAKNADGTADAIRIMMIHLTASLAKALANFLTFGVFSKFFNKIFSPESWDKMINGIADGLLSVINWVGKVFSNHIGPFLGKVWTTIKDFFLKEIPHFFVVTLPKMFTSVIDMISKFIAKHLYNMMSWLDSKVGIISNDMIKWLWYAAGGSVGTGDKHPMAYSFANGGKVGDGRVDGPTIALIGQAGPEAIVPLRESVYASNDILKSTNNTNTGLVEALVANANRPIQIQLMLNDKVLSETIVSNSMLSENLG